MVNYQLYQSFSLCFYLYFLFSFFFIWSLLISFLYDGLLEYYFFFKFLYLSLLLSPLSSHSGSTCNTKDFTSSLSYWSFPPAFFPIPTSISHLLLNTLYLSFDPFTTNILTVFLVFYFFLLSHLCSQLYHTSFHLSHLIVLSPHFHSFVNHSFGVPRTDDMKGLKLKYIGFWETFCSHLLFW